MLLITRPLLVLLVLMTVVVTSVWAQPGVMRTPEEIRQQLNQRLEQADEQIRAHPEQYNGYEMRGRAFAELSWRTNDAAERGFYAEKALTDLNKSIELEPNYWPNYTERARVRTYADRLKNFEDIRDDYVTAIRLIKKGNPSSSSDDYNLQTLYNQLADLY